MASHNDGWTELPEDWTFDVTVSFDDHAGRNIGWVRGHPLELGEEPERWWITYRTPDSDPNKNWTWPHLEDPAATVSEGLATIIDRYNEAGW